jgi:Flp pilus assembly protein CpaB
VKRSNRLVILVGVLLAVLAFVGIVILLNSNGSGGGDREKQTVTVVVAKEAIAIGDPVAPANAETREVETAAVEQTRLGDPSQLRGLPALVPIQAGEQITLEKAGQVAGAAPPITSQLEAGEKAIAFQVDRVTGLDFLILPGDHIDVVVAQDVTPIQEAADSTNQAPRFEAVTGLNNARTVKTILQDRRVLYVSGTRVRQVVTGQPSASAQQNQQTAQLDSVIIVFAGSDQDAELIKFAQRDFGEVGSLTAVVRRTADTEEGVEDPDTTGVTLSILVTEYGVPVPDIIVLATQAPRRNR